MVGDKSRLVLLRGEVVFARALCIVKSSLRASCGSTGETGCVGIVAVDGVACTEPPLEGAVVLVVSVDGAAGSSGEEHSVDGAPAGKGAQPHPDLVADGKRTHPKLRSR